MNHDTTELAPWFLSCGFDRGHTNRLACDATGDLDFLSGKLTSLFLARLIELVNDLAIAIREHELSVLCTHQGAVLLIHAGHVLKTTGTVTDESNHAFSDSCLGS